MDLFTILSRGYFFEPETARAGRQIGSGQLLLADRRLGDNRTPQGARAIGQKHPAMLREQLIAHGRHGSAEENDKCHRQAQA